MQSPRRASDSPEERIFGRDRWPGSTVLRCDLTGGGGLVDSNRTGPLLWNRYWSEWMAEVTGDGRR